MHYYFTDIASGTSIDWMYEKQNVSITYTIELRDSGRYGFLLPADQIIDNCLETKDAIIAMVAETRQFDLL